MKNSLKLSVPYLLKIQSYCDKRCCTPDYGYSKDDSSFDDSVSALIGQQLSVISGSIEEIFSIIEYKCLDESKFVK